MSKRIFSPEQIHRLLENKNVRRCSERSITYDKSFKASAVKLYNEGLTSTEVFVKAGFDLHIIGRDAPKGCLKRWKQIYRTKGEEGLAVENRGKNGGRPKKIKDASEADKIKRLELEILYLKAENDFLVKLRVKRAESNSGRFKNTR